MVLPFVTFIAFDIETTGLSPAKDEIVEIAGIKFTLEKKGQRLSARRLGDYCSLIKPSRFIPKDATRIHHITDQMVDDAPPPAKVMSEFFRFCGLSTILVAHNAPFDTEFLAKSLKKHGMMIPGNPIIDSLKITKKIMVEASSHKLGLLAKKLGSQLDLSLDSQGLHRALYDCEVLKEVFCACLRKRFQESELAMDKAMVSLEKVHGPSLQFKSYT